MTIDPGQMTWDERLITRERALELAGRWPVYLEFDEIRAATYLRCCRCDQSCAAFEFGPGRSLNLLASRSETNVDDVLSGVLRHMVMAHDVQLSGGR